MEYNKRETEKRQKRKKSPKGPESELAARREVYDWIQCVVTALLFCVLLFSFFVRIVDVDGSSMFPTLEDEDKIIVSDLFYSPKQGDIIVFRKTEYKEEPLVKRVVAVGGQTVEIDFKEGVVYVDGVALDEPYTAEPTKEKLDFTGKIVVPEGSVFVLGDNRMHSTDSRYSVIGCVDERYIMGKVYFTVFPIKNFGSVYLS